MGIGVISQTFFFFFGEEMGWKSTGEEKVRFVFSYFLLPSLSLPLSGLKAYTFCCRLAFDQRSHTLSRGISEREREREEIGGGVEDKIVAVCSHLIQFRIHSITSYCDSHSGVFLAGVMDARVRQQEGIS